jgi:hypothetical protein
MVQSILMQMNFFQIIIKYANCYASLVQDERTHIMLECVWFKNELDLLPTSNNEWGIYVE